MRVRDIKSERLRKRVQDEQAIVVQKEYPPDSPNAQAINKYGLPPGDGFIVLPRDRTIQIDVSIQAEEKVLPSTVLERLIEESCHRVIANFCLCRDGMDCKDYPIDWGCIFLGEAAKAISPELGRAVSVEEALEYAAKCREAGLVHMVGRFTPDLHWLNEGVGPIEKLVTICNCCPCCCGMRVLPAVNATVREQMVARMPGVRIEITDDCTGCGACTDICMFAGVELDGEHAVITEKCRICGRCADVCPSDAISITIVDSQFVEDSVRNISSRVEY
jgi:ferredoxin